MANWFFSLLGKASGNVAEVDASSQLMVTTNQDPTKAGATRLYDASGSPLTFEENGSIPVSQDNLIFAEQVDGSFINTNKWITSVSVLAAAQANGFMTLNSANVTTASGYAIVSSIPNLPFYGDLPLELSISAKVGAVPQANATMEMGLGAVATNAAPTDGAFFRWSATGLFQAVVNNGGSETAITCTGAGVTLPPTVGVKYTYFIIVAEDHVQFYVDDVVVADIQNPAGIAYPFSAQHQPVFARVITGATPPNTAPQISIGQITAVQLSINQYRSWADVLVSLGQGAYQSPLTPFTQTANHANSASPTSATLSNTAAGYTTLGGRFQFAAPAGAATDFALFAFQVPAPYKFYCTGVAISTVNTGVAVGLTATILDWSIGLNASAVSLATADSPPASWAPRRIPIGMQALLALAGVGQAASDLSRRFDPPHVIDVNRFLHVIVQVPVGAATGSQVIRGDVLIQGYFE